MALRVVAHTDAVLEVEDRPTGLRLVGAVMALAGAATLGLGWMQDRHLAGAVGGLGFLGVGAGFMVAPADRRHRLDRRAGTLTVETRTQSSVTRDERRLADVTGVVVEAHPGNGRGTRSATFRIVYVFADGARLPWTSYFTSARRDKEACARLVREFLGLERSSAVSW